MFDILIYKNIFFNFFFFFVFIDYNTVKNNTNICTTNLNVPGMPQSFKTKQK